MPPASPALRRPVAFRLANRFLEAGWRSRLLDHPELDEQALLDRAMRETGLADFGGSWFRGPLAVLLRSLREEAQLNPVGRLVAHLYVLKLLRERLWAEQWFADNPAIRRRRLAAPVVVVGPMRSGTTRLHRLLAADDRFSHLRMFETVCPVPKPSRTGVRDRRPREAARNLALLHRANPATRAIHPTGPMEPEEELGLFVASAWGMKHETQWRVPGYARWCEGTDATPAYARMADLLRLTGWLRGEEPDRPWLLKTPQHMLDLPALLRIFPGARIIFIHRDPAAIVGSGCSLAWHQMGVHSDHVDPRWIGREWLRKTRLKIDRMSAARAGIPGGASIDVHYHDMERDWRSVMRRIYAFLDMDIEPVKAAMAAYALRSERDRSFRSHRYQLGNFGLEAAEVRQTFEDYVRDYAIPLDIRSQSRSRNAPQREPREVGIATG